MSKEVAMTFRVESDLRDKFNELAVQQQRPAGQVLRQLMRDYVHRQGTPTAVISETERRERQEHIDNGFGNVGLEGFVPSTAVQARARLYVEGRITMDEFANEK